MKDRFAFDEDKASLKSWYDKWSGCVAAVDFENARALFANDVVGFGTFMDMVEGLDALEANQWRAIWPTIKNFRFRTEMLRVSVSPDRLHAMAMVPWESTGFEASGEAYDRPGRATTVLVRTNLDAPWLGIHTHFSLYPREVQLSFGNKD
ncbi:MAG: nuclear transport factor 2 family protein [Gammaproteobacteria bacterium]|nr:nuclear transport factor 2 family protein [Gammaproteobacteria bacterium]